MSWTFLKEKHWSKDNPRYPDLLVPSGCESEIAFYLVFECPNSGNLTFTIDCLQNAIDPDLYNYLMTGDFRGCFGYINMSSDTPSGFSYGWGDHLIEILEGFNQDSSYVDPNSYYAIAMVDFKKKDESLLFKLTYL